MTRPEDRVPPVDIGARELANNARSLLAIKVDKATRVDTDGTLTGGGDLSADRTLGVDIPFEAERIRDVMGVALVAGAGITITVNDAGDTITISSP